MNKLKILLGLFSILIMVTSVCSCSARHEWSGKYRSRYFALNLMPDSSMTLRSGPVHGTGRWHEYGSYIILSFPIESTNLDTLSRALKSIENGKEYEGIEIILVKKKNSLRWRSDSMLKKIK